MMQKPVSETQLGDVVRATISTGQAVINGHAVQLVEQPTPYRDGREGLDWSMVKLVAIEATGFGHYRQHCLVSRDRIMTQGADGVWHLPLS